MKMFKLSYGVVFMVLLLSLTVSTAFAQSKEAAKSESAKASPDSKTAPSVATPAERSNPDAAAAAEGDAQVGDEKTESENATSDANAEGVAADEKEEKTDAKESAESTEEKVDTTAAASTAAKEDAPAATAEPSSAQDAAPVDKEKAEEATAASSGEDAQPTDTQTDAVVEADVEVVPSTDRSKENFISKSIPHTDRIVNILTSQTVRPGALSLTIDHRAHDSFWSGEDAWFDYLGLDSGNLKIGIGLRLGLKEYMDVGFYRLSNGTDMFDVYEFDTKMRFLNQDTGFVNASLRIGLTWFVQEDVQDAAGFLTQINVDRRLFGTLLLGTGFAIHTDSSNDRKRYEDDEQSAAVLGYVEWRPLRKFSVNGEMAAAVAGYKSKYPVYAISARFLTHRHSFSLVIANTQYMSADGIVTNSWRAIDELVFGFQITREFQLVNN